MAEVGDYSFERQLQVSFEQMYVPYQTPFTISQSEHYLRRIYTSTGGHPVYVTLDTGHMVGQHRFLKPSKQQLAESFEHDHPGLWLGSDDSFLLWSEYKNSGDIPGGVEAILSDMELNPQFFAAPEDTDEYTWIKRLAKYSPIFHMQQTDGYVSSHKSFTPENNKAGIINGERFFKTIHSSYEATDDILPPVDEIYLCFELFFSNTAFSSEIFSQLEQSLKYWRAFVPEDGMYLSEILSNFS